MDKLKEFLADDLVWCVAFVGVCVLVGLGKVKQETMELLLMAVIGRAAATKRAKSNDLPTS